MTYMWNGEQYVVIAAGGHSEAGTSIGDSVVAFRLAREGEAPSLLARAIDRPGRRFYAGAALTATALLLLGVWRRVRRARRRGCAEGVISG
jgi:quinoprotein glucose dehydrogenase